MKLYEIACELYGQPASAQVIAIHAQEAEVIFRHHYPYIGKVHIREMEFKHNLIKVDFVNKKRVKNESV